MLKKIKIKNQKIAFTLVELLVAISIMGIITIIAIPTINVLVQNKNKGIYEKYGESLVSSAKLYTDSYDMDLFGLQQSGCTGISYDKLKEKKLIKDIQIKNSTCKNVETYVIVKKYSGRYQYQLQLKCTDSRAGKKNNILYERKITSPICTEDSAATPPKITIEEPKENWITKDESYVGITIEDMDGLLQNNEVIYKWSKDATGTNVVTEKRLNLGNDLNDKSVTKKIPRPAIDGKYYLIIQPVNVVDVFGNHATKTEVKSLYKFDSHAPNCSTAITLLSSSTPAKTWTNKDIEFKFKFLTGELEVVKYKWITYTNGIQNISNENLPTVTTKKITGNGKRTYTIKLYDTAGNTSTCPANTEYYIDKEKPSCTITPDNPTKWNTKDVELTLKPVDEISGIGGKKITTSTTASYNGTSNIATQTKDTKSTKWYGYVKDKAGNIAQCSTSVKKDATKPKCEITVTKGTEGKNEWYTSDVNVKLTQSDATSGVKTKGLAITENPTNGKTTGTQTANTIRTWYGYVKDNAGNVKTCSLKVKKDANAPSVTYSINKTKESGGWYKTSSDSPFKLTAECTENVSGMSTFKIDGSNYTKSKNTISRTSSGRPKEFKITCTDKAGNSTTKSPSYYIRVYGRDSSCGCDTYARGPECACETRNSCRHSSCGCETYNYSFGGWTEKTGSSANSYPGRGVTACNKSNVGKYNRQQLGDQCLKWGSGGRICLDLRDHWRYRKCNKGSCKTYESCPNSSCSCKTYKRCSAAGCDTYKKCWHYD